MRRPSAPRELQPPNVRLAQAREGFSGPNTLKSKRTKNENIEESVEISIYITFVDGESDGWADGAQSAPLSYWRT
jgi:hypothetical protein